MAQHHANKRVALIALVAALIAIILSSWFSQPVCDPQTSNTPPATEVSSGNILPNSSQQEATANLWRDTYAQWTMAVFTVVATCFSIVAVIWARRAVNTSEAQVRAYFRVCGIRFDWEKEERPSGLKVVVSWENCGQSPAVKCLFVKDFCIVSAEANESVIKSFQTFDIGPGQYRTCSVGQVLHSEICAVSPDDVERLYAHETKLILYAAVIYTDVFGSRFIDETCSACVFPSGAGGKIRFTAYPHHNDYRRF